VSAGHPPPVVVRRGGTADVVAVTPAPPIGAAFDEAQATTIDLELGDTVLLFSDGLLDPQLDSDQALSAVAELAHNLGTSSLQQLTDGLAAATKTYAPSDDVVVLAVRRDG
jgi:serine phosphatase RsbU (regulator of sigma subunit)